MDGNRDGGRGVGGGDDRDLTAVRTVVSTQAGRVQGAVVAAVADVRGPIVLAAVYHHRFHGVRPELAQETDVRTGVPFVLATVAQHLGFVGVGEVAARAREPPSGTDGGVGVRGGGDDGGGAVG